MCVFFYTPFHLMHFNASNNLIPIDLHQTRAITHSALDKSGSYIQFHSNSNDGFRSVSSPPNFLWKSILRMNCFEMWVCMWVCVCMSSKMTVFERAVSLRFKGFWQFYAWNVCFYQVFLLLYIFAILSAHYCSHYAFDNCFFHLFWLCRRRRRRRRRGFFRHSLV